MDMLSTTGMTQEQIAAQASLYRRQNEHLIDTMIHDEGFRTYCASVPHDQFFAALCSSCKSDPLRCGRCALWGGYKQPLQRFEDIVWNESILAR